MKYLICHPYAFGKIREDAHKIISDIYVIIDSRIPIYPTKFIVPNQNPFIEYEKDDWEWLKYFGFAKEVEDRSHLNINITEHKLPTDMIVKLI